MIDKFNIDEWVDKYRNGSLTPAEKAKLEQAIQNDPILKKEWKEAEELYTLLDHAAAKQHVANSLAYTQNADKKTFTTATIQFVKKNWKTTAIAASFFIASLTAFQFLYSSKELGDNKHKFTQLSRDIENIKSSQNTILKTLEDNSNDAEAAPPTEYQMGGTGFAVANEGYIATNYHVVKESNTITVITQDKSSHDAIIVGYDATNDVAILKIIDKDFKFSKQPIPYNLINKKTPVLGLKIFSIGYPQDNLVYNEGYVSSENGYQGDSLSYQLEIVANPGQSGSPVIDKNGNIWGLINGKKSNTTGTTYAIKSKALLDLIHNMPEHLKFNTPKSNTIAKMDRPEQVEVLKSYIVTIKTAK